jgi:hypothetical protein
MAKPLLAVGIGALVVQVSLAGSYSSLTLRKVLLFKPPIAYILPFTTATPSPALAVGMEVFVTQEPSVVAVMLGNRKLDRSSRAIAIRIMDLAILFIDDGSSNLSSIVLVYFTLYIIEGYLHLIQSIPDVAGSHLKYCFVVFRVPQIETANWIG